jgi:uncharacterized membrane protein YsdA (DUF1294 family)
MKTMSKVWTVALLLAAVVLVWADPVRAQESVTGASELPLWVGYMVGGVILAVFAFAAWVQHTSNARVKTMTDTLTMAIRELSASVPQSVLSPGQAIVEGGVRSAADYVEGRITSRTPTTLDDKLLDEGERKTLNLLRKLGLVAGPIAYDADPDTVGFGQIGDMDDTSPVVRAAAQDPNATLAGPQSGL